MNYDLPTTDHSPLPIMTVGDAHRIMQSHIDCPISVCPVKQQAKKRLVEDGRMVPADTPHIGS